MKRLASILIYLSFVACVPDFLKQEKSNSENSTDGKKKTGIVKTKYEDGSVRAEISFTEGKKDGLAKEYYRNGRIFQEIMYSNGIKHGRAKRYYENGQLYQETPYDSGKIEGIQKKYRSDGKLSAEIPYHKNNPCVGLKEYLTDGSPRRKYPSIIVTPVDNIWKDGHYTLRISMSDNTKRVEYYRGSLAEGECLSNFMGNIFETQKGVAEITYVVPPGTFIMEQVNIVAKVETLLGNDYITQIRYNVAAENR
ncbi:MAG: toxin-antitoxin system YwqK family antitoxin [Cyclobacteriaceae bacterium]|nr:toxin-antitoxin system YwqK family antitoxin [Cyclobacteriaceae bacterium]